MRYAFARLWLGLLLLVTAWAGPAGAPRAAPEAGASPSLSGQFLVASPAMPDPRFARTVIYMVSHDVNGAMGLVINRSFGSGSLRALLQGFGLDGARTDRTVQLNYGGPVEQARGFVLHSTDYAGASTRPLTATVALSTGPDILNAFAQGDGPSRHLFLLGYAGWGPGQLEGELARDDWLLAPADERLIFSGERERLWDEVMQRAGTPL